MREISETPTESTIAIDHTTLPVVVICFHTSRLSWVEKGEVWQKLIAIHYWKCWTLSLSLSAMALFLKSTLSLIKKWLLDIIYSTFCQRNNLYSAGLRCQNRMTKIANGQPYEHRKKKKYIQIQLQFLLNTDTGVDWTEINMYKYRPRRTKYARFL